MGDEPNQDIQKDLTKIEDDISKGNWSSAYPEIAKIAETKEGRDLFNARLKDKSGILPELELRWGKDKLKQFDTNGNGLSFDEIVNALHPSAANTKGIDRLVMGQLGANFARIAGKDRDDRTITPDDLARNRETGVRDLAKWQ